MADANTCGGKAVSLGGLVRAGLPVPDGFVIPFAVSAQDLDLDTLDRALDALGRPPVAVRSSAADEDTSRVSAAGRYDSFLAVQGVDAVAEAVRACWASLFSLRATADREACRESATGAPAMAVIVQRHVDADASGVMFTPADPRGETAIEASWGLGPSVAGGTVVPDTYRVSADGSVTVAAGGKPTRVDRRGMRLVTSDVPVADRFRPSIDEREAVSLSELGARAATALGAALDIEWAIVGGCTWLLQARPVTATPPGARPPGPALTAISGTPGSRGTATGYARIVRSPGDFAHVRAGDILVCRYTEPAWTPLLHMVVGVVTETGGVLSHAAIVARERTIPAVLGVPGAMRRIRDGTTITIDGNAGTVSAVDGPSAP